MEVVIMQSYSPTLTVNRNNYCWRMTAADVMDQGELRSLLTGIIATVGCRVPAFSVKPPSCSYSLRLQGHTNKVSPPKTYTVLISFPPKQSGYKARQHMFRHLNQLLLLMEVLCMMKMQKHGLIYSCHSLCSPHELIIPLYSFSTPVQI